MVYTKQPIPFSGPQVSDFFLLRGSHEIARISNF